MAVTSSGKIQVDIKYKGNDDTAKASKSAAGNINKVRDGAKRAGGALKKSTSEGKQGFLGLGKGVASTAAKFTFMGAAIGMVRSGFGSLVGSIGETLTLTARLEYAFGSLEAGMEKAANTGHSIGVSALADMAATAKVAGIQFKLTAEQVSTIGNMAKIMGKDSDQMFALVTKAVAAGRPTMLKQLGIFIDSKEAFEAYGEQMNITTKQMGQSDKQAATLNAVLKALNKTAIEGGAAFDKFDQAQRQAQSGWAVLKAKFLEPLADTLSENVIFLLNEAGIQGKNAGVELEDSFMGASRRAEQLVKDIKNVGGAAATIRGLVAKDKSRLVTEDVSVGDLTKGQFKQQEKYNDELKQTKQLQKDLFALQRKRAQLRDAIATQQGLARGHVEWHKIQKKTIIRLQKLEESQVYALARSYREWGEAEGRVLLGRKEGEKVTKEEIRALQQRFRLFRDFRAQTRYAGSDELLPELPPGAASRMKDYARWGRMLGGSYVEVEKQIAKGNEQLKAANKETSKLDDANEKIALKKDQIIAKDKVLHLFAKQRWLNESKINQLIRSRVQYSQNTERATLSLLNRQDVVLTTIADRNQSIFDIKKAMFAMERKAALAKLREDEARFKREKTELFMLRIKAEGRFSAITGKSALTGKKIGGPLAMGDGGELAQYKSFRKAGAWNAQLAAQEAALKAEAKAAKLAAQKYREASRATNTSLKLAQAQIKLWEGAKIKDPEKTRRKSRRGGGGRRPDIDLGEVGTMDREKVMLQLRRQSLGLTKAQTDAERVRAIQARLALDLEQEKLDHKRKGEALDRTVAEAQAKVDKVKKLRKSELAKIGEFNRKIDKAGQDQEWAHLQKIAAIKTKAAAQISRITEEARKRFEADKAALVSELRGESELDAARRLHIERLERINDLRSRGLLIGEAELLKARSQAQVRSAMFDEWASNTQGAIQMGLSMDSIVSKYSQMKDAAGSAGEVGLTAGQSFVKGTALFLQGVNQQSKQINKTITMFTEANKKGAAGYAKATASAIAVGGQLAASVVEDEKAKAAILGVSELAASFAAYPDPVGVASHAVASALYFAIAGGAGKGKATGAETTPTQVTAQGGTEEEMAPGTTIININAPVVGGTDQEIGAKIGEWMGGNAGSGFGG